MADKFEMKKAHGERETVKVFSVKRKNEILARRFHLVEALALCKRYDLNPNESCTDQVVEVVWLNGAAYILGPEVL